MKLIVGLGNPGKEYENTRHNVGFIILDSFTNVSWKNEKDASVALTNINGEKVCMLKPLTYMNLSGFAVSRIANYYKINSEDVLVIHDDLDLDSGIHRLKFSSSSGGHNGIKSIIEQLGTKDFCRLKIGIGSNKNENTSSYVLNKLSTEEINNLKSGIYKEIIEYFVQNGIDKTMNKYNFNEEK